jgi:uncharacterized protein YbaR (Trm112 family)
MAECSLSTGSNLMPYSFANGMTSAPPATKVSLLASANVLACPYCRHNWLQTGDSTMAATTASASAIDAAALLPAILIHDFPAYHRNFGEQS